MATVRDWVTQALRKNGVLGFSESVAGEDAAIALEVFRNMVDSWNLEPNWLYSTYSDGFTLTPNVATYSTSLLAQGRPTSIVAGKVFQSPVAYDVNFVFSAAEYANQISLPLAQAGIPRWCWYNASMPDGVFTFWPVPYSNFALQLQCTGSVIASVATLDLDTVVSVPPGYTKAFVDALAVESADSFGAGANITPRMEQVAIEAKDWVKAKNRVPRDVRNMGLWVGQGARGKRYDIYGDN